MALITSLIIRSCMADGTLLQPDRPARIAVGTTGILQTFPLKHLLNTEGGGGSRMRVSLTARRGCSMQRSELPRSLTQLPGLVRTLRMSLPKLQCLCNHRMLIARM